jgi:hypothetical protein
MVSLSDNSVEQTGQREEVMAQAAERAMNAAAFSHRPYSNQAIQAIKQSEPGSTSGQALAGAGMLDLRFAHRPRLARDGQRSDAIVTAFGATAWDKLESQQQVSAFNGA